MSEDRGQRQGVGCQVSGIGRRMTDVSEQITDVRRWRTDARRQRSEDRFIVTECGLRPVGAMGAYAPEGSGNAESVGSQNSHRHTQTHTDIFFIKD